MLWISYFPLNLILDKISVNLNVWLLFNSTSLSQVQWLSLFQVVIQLPSKGDTNLAVIFDLYDRDEMICEEE